MLAHDESEQWQRYARAQAYLQYAYDLGEAGHVPASPRGASFLSALEQQHAESIREILNALVDRTPEIFIPLVCDPDTLCGTVAEKVGFRLTPNTR